MKSFFNAIALFKTVLVTTMLISATLVNSQINSSKFTVDKTIACFTNNVFSFTNVSLGDSLQYHWDFNDGTFSTATNPIKTFAAAGIYNVTLITTKNSLYSYFSKQIIVAPEPVTSNISIQNTLSGNSYTYISSSTILFGYMSYYWTFADSVNATLINPTHTYKTSGIYNVELDVTSNYGCATHLNKLINIALYDSTVVLPIFIINKEKQCLLNNNFAFYYTGDTTGITSFNWDFGDGTTSNLITPNKTYTQAGNYIVKLTITINGIVFTNEKIVKIINQIDASFTAVLKNDSTTFVLIPTDTTLLETYNTVWNFGDGTNSNTMVAQHNYYPGTYTVNFKITSPFGCTDSVSKNVIITKLPLIPIVALFTVNDTLQCINTNIFTTTNTSTTGTAIKYDWNFGDGTTSTLFQPTKVYATTGNYIISLTVTAGSIVKYYEKKVVVTNTSIWLGASNSNWFDANNWVCAVPTTLTNVLIKKGAINMPIIINTNNIISAANITIENGASLHIVNSIFNVYGNVVNNGILNAGTSTINFVGTTQQTTSGILEIGNMVMNNSAGLQINNSILDSIRVLKILTLKLGNLNTANKLVLVSTATQTAKLDKVNTAGNTGTITGNVSVERYFFNKRAWRFYTIPFTANGNNSNYSINNTFQKFTNVTGTTGIGFDYLSPAYSLNSWNVATNKWETIKNTYTSYAINNNLNFSNIPYFIFIRGDKSIGEAWVSSEVIFSFSGQLQTGNQIQNFSGRKKGNYLFIGNPYASPIDLSIVQTQSKGLSGNFYYWDPSLNTNGAYVTISNKGNGVWIATPAAAQKGRYIQSGAAALFEVADTAGFVKFTEEAKSDTNYVNTLGAANGEMDKLTVNLYKINNDGSKSLVDGAITLFNKNYSTLVDANDSKKILNPEENIGFNNGNDILAIESRPYVEGEDSLQIYTSDLKDSTQYAIEILTNYFDTTVQQIILVDSFIQNKTAAFFNQSTWYYFTKNTASASAGKRFSIVLKSTKVINGKIEKFTATKQDKKIKLSWNVDAEQGVKEYSIEYSSNGIDFETIKTQIPLNNNKTNNYTHIDDVNGKVGNYYYRIKTINTNDIEQYSNIVAVEFVAEIVANKQLSAYPNPTKNRFNIHFYATTTQWLVIQITEPTTGKIIATKNVNAKKGENIFNINFDEYSNIKSGLYIINIVGEDIVVKPIKMIYNK